MPDLPDATDTPATRPLIVESAEAFPMPAVLDALPVVHIVPYGPVVRNTDVAKAFKTKPVMLRTWRSRGAFPQTAGSRGNVSFYYKQDLIGPYYQMFPEALQEAQQAQITAASQAVTQGVSSSITLSESMRDELRAIVRDGVTEAIEREPESPDVIGTQAAELRAQRKEIERLEVAVTRLEGELAEALRWRDKSFSDRVLKR